MSQPNRNNNTNLRQNNNKRRRRRRRRNNNHYNQSNSNNNNNNNNTNNNNYDNNNSNNYSNNSGWNNSNRSKAVNNYSNNSNNSGWNKPTKAYKLNKNQSINNGCCNDWIQKSTISKQKIYISPYSSPYFDTHCHLDWILFKSGYGLNDLKTFADTHLQGNFGGCVTVACSPDMIRPVSELINSTNIINQNIYATFGIHPHNAKEWNSNVKQRIIFAAKTGKWKIQQNNNNNNHNNKWLCLCGYYNNKQHVFCIQCTYEPSKEYLQNIDLLEKVKKEQLMNNDNDQKNNSNNSKVVGVGECGLDFHYNRSPQNIQKKVFIEQIEISKQLDLPLVVHSREAENDTIEIMKKYCPKNKKIHLHCFTDSLPYAKVMLNEFPNLFIGFTGSITFKNARNNRNNVKNIPLNRILLETDGPYMAPDPFRGKISHPGYIPIVAQKIAEIHGITDVNVVLKQCRLNATKMYGV